MATSPPDRSVITGARGFVGTALASRLPGARRISLSGEGWREAIRGADLRGATVIHLAARVHEPHGDEGAFLADNAGKTEALARAAAEAGAARFVLASTVKVFGEESPGRPWRESDPPAPADGYARSKLAAERAVATVGAETGLAVAVVRIPLVWGPGVAGNFRSLVALAASGHWLPFASISNRRSVVHVEDLADALATVATHPAAPGRTWIAAHPVAVSTPSLVSTLRSALGIPARLFPMPPWILEAGATLAGRGATMRRLTRSLEVDAGPLASELGWVARIGLKQGLPATIDAWRAQEGR